MTLWELYIIGWFATVAFLAYPEWDWSLPRIAGCLLWPLLWPLFWLLFLIASRSKTNHWRA